MTNSSDLVVFQSHPDFSDSPRALYEYMKGNADFELMWIVSDVGVFESLQKCGIDCNLEGSIEAEDSISRAKYLVSAAYELALNKKRDQISICVWHGFSLKLLGFSDTSVSSEDDFFNIRAIVSQYDIVAASSRAGKLLFSGMYACDPRKVFTTGFPRNDFLFSTNGRSYLEQILNRNILNSKLALYLPTMRQGLKAEGGQFENNIFNYSNYDASKIDKILEEQDAYIIVKLHPSDDLLFDHESFELPKRVILLSSTFMTQKLITLYHVLNAFDCLITDYSSIYVDYLLLDRPIVFSCPDIDLYEKDRGFCVDDPQFLMPGIIVKDQQALLNALESIFSGHDDSKQKRTAALPFFQTHVDGNSSERVFELMLKAKDGLPEDAAKLNADLYLKPDMPLYKYTLEVNAKLFYDYGRGFEKEYDVFKYYADDVRIEHRFKITRNTRAIRLHPCENSRFIFKNLTFIINGKEEAYKIDNAAEFDNLIFAAIDPRITIYSDIPDGSEVIIRFEIIDSLAYNSDNFGDLLNAINNAKENSNMLDSMRSSISWKITEPLRFVNSVFKKWLKRHIGGPY